MIPPTANPIEVFATTFVLGHFAWHEGRLGSNCCAWLWCRGANLPRTVLPRRPGVANSLLETIGEQAFMWCPLPLRTACRLVCGLQQLQRRRRKRIAQLTRRVGSEHGRITLRRLLDQRTMAIAAAAALLALATPRAQVRCRTPVQLPRLPAFRCVVIHVPSYGAHRMYRVW